jgi:hypothetical protein
MKNLFCCLVLSFFLLACTHEKRSPVEGAWNLVQSTWIRADTLYINFPGTFTGSDMKMWSKGYVLYVGRYQRDTTFIDGYGGGPYKLEGNQYEEEIQYFSDQKYVGNKVKMLLEIRNDTLIQTWPLNANGQIDKSNYRQEKYIRLD